jgi:hypothetical protein
MIITRRTANKHIASGSAEIIGQTTDNGKTYDIVQRNDMQRVDHVEAK